MRQLKRIFFIIVSLLLIVLCSIFVSCGDSDKNKEELEEIESIFEHLASESELDSNKETDSETQTDTETNTETEEQTVIGEHLYVVIPKDASAKLVAKVQELVDGLIEKTDLLVTLKYDYAFASSPSGTCEILVGNTNRLESQNISTLLKQDDYSCRWDTGKLVICGGSDDSTIEAVQKFIDDVLPNVTKYLLMDNDGGFEKNEQIGQTENNTDSESSIETAIGIESSKETETVPKMSTINGYGVNEFSIVYNGANKFDEKLMAEIVCEFIKARSGYLLDVISTDDLTSKVGKTITLSVDESAMSGIESADGSITLKGANAYTLSIVVSRFIESIDENTKSGIMTLNFDKKLNISKASSKFELMTYFVKKLGDATSLIELLDVLTLEKKDAYVIANVDEKLTLNISRNLPENYAIYETPSFKRNIIVVYNVNLIKNITSKVNEHSLDVKFELFDGETIKYRYFVSVDSNVAESLSDESMEKTICFFEGKTDSVEFLGLRPIIYGSATLDNKTVNYGLIIGDFVREDQDSLITKNTDKRLSCSARIFINISDRLLELNDSL